jgi:hypothetical protein
MAFIIAMAVLLYHQHFVAFCICIVVAIFVD